MAVNFSKARDGDRFRRIADARWYDVELGDIFRYRDTGYNELVSERTGRELGTANAAAWELVKSEEEKTLTNVTAEALLAKLEALTSEVAKFVATEKDAKPSPRRQVIEKARKDVDLLSDYHPMTETRFHVNQKKGTVTALIVGKTSGTVYHKGIAKVSYDDKFDAYIGKAIALRRAIGKDVPNDFTNAPQK